MHKVARAAQRVEAVDVVRFVTVFGVIAVHATSFANSQQSLAANAALQVLHVTRSVFLLVSATVLCISWGRHSKTGRAFWKRRYPLVLLPYMLWSGIYVLADNQGGSLRGDVGRFVVDLFDGGAKYHLYFLLLTFQLYLVFPALMAAVRRWPRAVGPAVVASAVFQLLFDAGVHYDWRPPVLGVWFSHPSSWLASYAFYVVAGVAAGTRLAAFTGWVRTHYRLVAALLAGSVALSLLSYLADLTFLRYTPVKASEVFQPANTVEAAAAAVGQFAFGLWLTERAGPRRRGRLARAADDSFGVYLAHPLVLGVVLNLAGSLGIAASLAGLPSGIVELLIVGALVPFVYAVAFFGIDLARRTRASLLITGRRATVLQPDAAVTDSR